MRLNLFTVAVLASALALPKVAAADVIDDFTLTGPGTDVVFSMPGTGVALAYNDASGNPVYASYTGTVNGALVSGTVVIDVSNYSSGPFVSLREASGGQYVGTVNLWYFGQYTEVLSDVVISNPASSTGYSLEYAFLPVSLTLYEPGVGVGPSFYEFYNLTITPEAATLGATPEPGTLLLLSTGLVGGWGLLRRRIVS